MKKEMEEFSESSFEYLCKNSINLIKTAQVAAVKQVDKIQLITYFILGMWIVEEQQNGSERAGYGKK